MHRITLPGMNLIVIQVFMLLEIKTYMMIVHILQ